MFSLTVATVLLATFGTQSVKGQTTDVNCGSRWSWMDNDMQQNPCLVAAYLENQCVVTGGNWNVGVLQENNSYVGPKMAQADYCQCSSVTYQLISACAACQDETWIPWSRWRFNCTDLNTSVGYWPLDLPPGTSVPAWAYMDPRSGDTFNVTVARTLIDVPESTYIGYPTAPISIVPSTTSQRPFVSTFTLLPSSSASPSGGGGSSNTGAIVGGVVGGVAVIAFVVGLFVYLWKKRHEGPVISPVSPIRPHDGRIDMAESESNHTRIQFYPQITGSSPDPSMGQLSPTVYNHSPPPMGYNQSPPPMGPTGYNQSPPPVGKLYE
ncbi:hypothetical protein FRC03_006399 [Tulasnella sp. 419]|nr:hypothetical protein FRC03_006399 [Tulasnella sp. 419]